ncbi:MAG: hypothetical protein GY858_05525 [Candidatus Omnitrophica bacterium]|nr:hypothetical protein [Candidatus Omnitrophota bacterium]
MITYKCDLCAKEREMKFSDINEHQSHAHPRFGWIYKDKDTRAVEITLESQPCHECEGEIKQAQEKAEDKAKQEAIEKIKAGVKG